MWIKQAIEAAGSDDPTAIRDQLEATTSFDGLLGHMSIDPATHNPSRDAAIFEVKDNEVQYVGIYEPEQEQVVSKLKREIKGTGGAVKMHFRSWICLGILGLKKNIF